MKPISRRNLWESLPRPLKTVAGGALSLIPLSWALGGRFRRHLAFARQAQWWSADQSREWQRRALRSVYELAYERTAYYRRVFDSAGFDPRDMDRLEGTPQVPLIDRRTLQEHLPEMCAVPPGSPGVEYASTGGSTGQPLAFYIGTDRSAVEYAYLVAGWERAGFRLGMPLATVRGRIVQPDRNGLRHEYDPLLRQHYYSNFHMSDDNIARYLDHLGGIGPCFLHVYPSSVAAIARYLRRTGRPAPENVRGILAGSENVYPEQRAMVGETIAAPYFSWYGHTEKLILAAECEHSSDYHVWPTYGYVELLDDAGEPVTTPGQVGEIVGTGFINRVVPFIRYRTGDYAAYVSDHCKGCGRRQMILRDIRGHNAQEFLLAADGTQISWTAMNMHDETFLRVRQFQFYQDRPGHAVLKIVPADGFKQDETEAISRSLDRKFEGRLRLSFQMTDAIPVTGRGKFVYVDQRIAGLGSPEAGSQQPVESG